MCNINGIIANFKDFLRMPLKQTRIIIFKVRDRKSKKAVSTKLCLLMNYELCLLMYCIVATKLQ